MKTCIWCKRNDNQTSFFNRAHTIPKSLGGRNICKNVCDDCNSYFGSKKPNMPSIEIVVKEMLNISRFYLLKTTNSQSSGNPYKSEYFSINWEKFEIRLRPKYSLKKDFQLLLGKQFRKGIFKIFLEERERQRNDALSERFDFIREFARYDKGDFPIYIQIPRIKAIFAALPDIKHPQIRFTEYSDQTDEIYRIYGYQLMGHNFLIPTSPLFEKFYLKKFLQNLKIENHPFGTSIMEVRYAENIDYSFRYLNG